MRDHWYFFIDQPLHEVNAVASTFQFHGFGAAILH
jgi:hypothetical protein